MDIEIKVQKQKAVYIGPALVANSRNYLYAHYDFDGDWDGLLKTAIFRNGSTAYNVPLDSDNRCLIPEQVLKSGTLEASVFAGDRLTATRAIIPIIRSGYEEADAPPAPEPDVYYNLTQMAAQAVATANSVRADADAGMFNGEKGETGAPGKDGTDGHTPERGVDYWTEADKAQIVADVLAALPNGDEVSY